MQLISTNGDTSYVKRLKELRFVSIGEHLFYHDYKIGYIEVIHKRPVSLGVLNFMVNASWDVRGTTSKYDRYYKKEKFYYFLDKDKKSYKATPSSIQKLYYDQRKKIKAYLDENRVDFKIEGDLINLLAFCDGLTTGSQN